MKATWTIELAQDLAAYHSYDIEAGLTQLLAKEIVAEIAKTNDYEIALSEIKNEIYGKEQKLDTSESSYCYSVEPLDFSHSKIFYLDYKHNK
jgi:hypothetical protein